MSVESAFVVALQAFDETIPLAPEMGAPLPDGSVRWRRCEGSVCQRSAKKRDRKWWMKKVDGKWLCLDCRS